VNCLGVRDRLVERVLGGLSVRELGVIDRHLAWCAACRKEVGELERAAGTLAFALAPSEPAPELEDRVVASVAGLSAGGRAPAPRRGRMAVAATVAAMLAVGGLGWGAVMAGRATRLEQQAAADAEAADRALENFGDLLEQLPASDAEPRFADLLPAGVSGGSGSALAVSSGSGNDTAIVLVSGLAPAAGPYVVELMGHEGDTLRIGRFRTLGPDGSGELQRILPDEDLTLYERVVVADRRGKSILQGALLDVSVTSSAAP